MTKRVKVLSGLIECARPDGDKCSECPYNVRDDNKEICRRQLMSDACDEIIGDDYMLDEIRDAVRDLSEDTENKVRVRRIGSVVIANKDWFDRMIVQAVIMKKIGHTAEEKHRDERHLEGTAL